MLPRMIDERQLALRIADGDLPSPQQFGSSCYWLVRVTGTGAAWRESVQEFCYREPSIWLTPEMCARAACLPIIIDHPESGLLNSQEFAARAVGMTTHAFVRDTELWAVARILDSGANRILEAGAYEDTGPAVSFATGTALQRIEIDDKTLLIEPAPMLIDHLALCARGVWTRDGEPGVEVTEEVVQPRG